jgi:hypothetical protein
MKLLKKTCPRRQRISRNRVRRFEKDPIKVSNGGEWFEDPPFNECWMNNIEKIEKEDSIL